MVDDPLPLAQAWRTDGETFNMGNLLYILAVVLVIGWLLGVFVYSATGLIHVLLVIAIVAILLRVIQSRGTKV